MSWSLEIRQGGFSAAQGRADKLQQPPEAAILLPGGFLLPLVFIHEDDEYLPVKMNDGSWLDWFRQTGTGVHRCKGR